MLMMLHLTVTLLRVNIRMTVKVHKFICGSSVVKYEWSGCMQMTVANLWG